MSEKRRVELRAMAVLVEQWTHIRLSLGVHEIGVNSTCLSNRWTNVAPLQERLADIARTSVPDAHRR